MKNFQFFFFIVITIRPRSSRYCNKGFVSDIVDISEFSIWPILRKDKLSILGPIVWRKESKSSFYFLENANRDRHSTFQISKETCSSFGFDSSFHQAFLCPEYSGKNKNIKIL